MTSSIRVLIADDQPLVRSGLRTLLTAECDLEVVGEAANGADACEQVAVLSPDVVLMDVRMPVLDGIAATRRLAEHHPATRVLVLTTFELDEYVFGALRAGASGFVLKDIAADQLARAVRIVAAGHSLLDRGVTARVVDAFAAVDIGSPEQSRRLAALSRREHQVLRMLATGASNAEIAEGLVVSAATVKTHVASVLGKLGLRDRVHAVVFAYESGFIVPGSPARDR